MILGIPFVKGHGTQNDFVVLPDLDAELELHADWVATLCDRRRGLGADGVLRVTTAAAARAAGVFAVLPEGVAGDDWYMDYRNADGSIAQMCGNGVRVFAHYLRAAGLEHRDEFVVGSLAGPRPVVVRIDAGESARAEVTVDMGKAVLLGTGSAALAALVDGGDDTGTLRVRIPGGEVTVTITEATSYLHGPSALVARGDYAGD